MPTINQFISIKIFEIVISAEFIPYEDTYIILLWKTSLMFTLMEPKTANISKAKKSEEFLLSDHWHIIPTQRLLRNDAGHWWSQQAKEMGKNAINERDITSIKQFFLNKLLSQEGMNPNEKIKNTCLLFWVNAYGFFQISANCVWPLVIQKDLARPQKAFHNFHPIPASYGWLVYFMTAAQQCFFFDLGRQPKAILIENSSGITSVPSLCCVLN